MSYQRGGQCVRPTFSPSLTLLLNRGADWESRVDISVTEIDLASGLWMYAHNDSGHGGYFNDLDMIPIGMGDFLANSTSANGHPAVSQSEAKKVGQTYFTMWTILKSTLLLSTRIELLADYHIATVTNRDAIAIHQGACLMFSQ